ncbi:tyrosine-protein phosphatase [Saccharopolyspora taberi]
MTEADGLDGLVNLRDLGGIPLAGGETTSTGVVLRSDAPYHGDRDPELTWPPKTVVDLRDPAELNGRGHPLAAVAEVRSVPLLEDVGDGDPDDTRHALTHLYEHIVDRAPHRLVEVFRIAVEADGPVLIHCAAGKDRTGVASAMLLGAVGARPDAIVADYVRTDRNMRRVLMRLNGGSLPPGVDEEMVLQLASTPVEAIELVLSRFDQHGGAAGWLRSHGVRDEEIELWRKRFVDAG